MTKDSRVAAIEAALDYQFNAPERLLEALTHGSFRHERGGTVDYERLEFLGDAVVELCVTELLFSRFPRAREGRMTQLRATLVNARTLAAVARRIGLGEQARMGRGEQRTGGRDRPSILSDLLEATLGAIFLDGGYAAAREVLVRLLAPELDAIVADDELRDSKSQLQEWAQQLHQVTPGYSLVEVSGPSHDASFEAEVQVGEVLRARGTGNSKKEAEQRAASAALEALLPSDIVDGPA